MKQTKSARQLVVLALSDWEKQKKSRPLEQWLHKDECSAQDAAFATQLYNGVQERRLTLNFVLEKYLKRKPDPVILSILQTGIYQLLYMDSVPDHAAVNECVNLCSVFKKTSAKGFVNGVLRSFLKDGKCVDTQLIADPVERLSIEKSCGMDVLEDLLADWGEDSAADILERSLHPPVVFGRVNTTKTSADLLLKRLDQEGVKAAAHELLPHCIRFESGVAVERLSSFQEGLFHIQDLSSQICSAVVADGMKPGDVCFDLCAAPGGKSFTIAQQMGDAGVVRSFDLTEYKCKLCRDGAQRLGIQSIAVQKQDASVYNPDLGTADRVLCDVPCSGLGTLSKKPDIKYKQREEYGKLPEIQSAILTNAARYVKDGGLLVYSTCTLLHRENELIVKAFLEENPQFKPCVLPETLAPCRHSDAKHCATILPEHFGSDGFFIAAMRKE